MLVATLMAVLKAMLKAIRAEHPDGVVIELLHRSRGSGAPEAAHVDG